MFFFIYCCKCMHCLVDQYLHWVGIVDILYTLASRCMHLLIYIYIYIYIYIVLCNSLYALHFTCKHNIHWLSCMSGYILPYIFYFMNTSYREFVQLSIRYVCLPDHIRSHSTGKKSIQLLLKIYPTIDIHNSCADFSYLNYIYFIYHENTISY